MPVKQEYYDTPSHVIAAGVVLPLMDIVAIALRFWMRIKQRQGLKTDDWLMIPATALTAGIGISLIYGVSQEAIAYYVQLPPGYEDDPFDAHSDQLTITGKVQWAYLLMLPLVLGCIKTSFLLFYMRIFSVNNKNITSIILYGLVGLVVTWAAAFFFADLFVCGVDFWAIWGSIAEGISRCANTNMSTIALCITDFITDVIIMCIPIPLVWRLNMSLPKRIAVMAIFLLGGVAVAASLTRLILTARLVEGGFGPDADAILTTTDTLYWGLVEASAGILAACLPTLQFLFRGLSRERVTTTTRKLGISISSRTRILQSKVSKNTIRIDQEPDATFTPKDNASGGSKVARWPPSIEEENPASRDETYSMEDMTV
ncbi:plasma membrane protein Pth11-like protein [Hypoxylon fuscum]|nr:plasma membrane protein Pth11-like protein [Hypoxylon fuscum]